jgi:hypothetical protein
VPAAHREGNLETRPGERGFQDARLRVCRPREDKPSSDIDLLADLPPGTPNTRSVRRATGIPPELWDSEPTVPWREIIGMRNWMAHRCFDSVHAYVGATVDPKTRRGLPRGGM